MMHGAGLNGQGLEDSMISFSFGFFDLIFYDIKCQYYYVFVSKQNKKIHKKHIKKIIKLIKKLNSSSYKHKNPHFTKKYHKK